MKGEGGREERWDWELGEEANTKAGQFADWVERKGCGLGAA